jgi:membrane-bound serine protease (ClpP class)
MHSPPSGTVDARAAAVLRCVKALVLLLGIAVAPIQPAASAAGKGILLEIDGAIGPAIADYIVRELSSAAASGAGVVILRMNTPGGLDTSMREIISAILASPVPVVSYVAPNGARAASAGTYIAYASAIAAMAPSTNIGAATPVRLGVLPHPEQPPGQQDGKQKRAPDAPSDAETRKAVNDAVAYIRGLAELNGRDAGWAVEAVRGAASLPASEALKRHVIDVIADDLPDLLRKIDGRTVKTDGRPERLATANLELVRVKPDWRTELLAVITNPNIAFIFMLIGIYGLIFEFLSPGAIAPGLIGAISLLVALYGFSLLPISYAGVALVLLGIGLLLAEAHIGSFGAIGVGGIVAFVIGAIMMFPSGTPGLELSPAVIVTAASVSVCLLVVALSMLLRSRKRRVITGKEALLGAEGEAVTWQDGEGRIRIGGEIWRACATGPLQPGARVKVMAREGLVLIVERIR